MYVHQFRGRDVEALGVEVRPANQTVVAEKVVRDVVSRWRPKDRESVLDILTPARLEQVADYVRNETQLMIERGGEPEFTCDLLGSNPPSVVASIKVYLRAAEGRRVLHVDIAGPRGPNRQEKHDFWRDGDRTRWGFDSDITSPPLE